MSKDNRPDIHGQIMNKLIPVAILAAVGAMALSAGALALQSPPSAVKYNHR